MELGFRTILIDDCSRGIDHGDIAATFEKIREQNGLVVQSNEVCTDIQKIFKISLEMKSDQESNAKEKKSQ